MHCLKALPLSTLRIKTQQTNVDSPALWKLNKMAIFVLLTLQLVVHRKYLYNEAFHIETLRIII